jgi:hypothetical protein
MLIRQGGAAVLVLSILILPSIANILNENDYTVVDNLESNSSQLDLDLLSVSQGTSDLDLKQCVGALSESVERTGLELRTLLLLVLVSTRMVDRLDEQFVLKMLRVQGESFTKKIEVERKLINGAAGTCAWTNVVPVKSQEVLAFYRQAVSVVRSILKRI